VPLMVFCIYVDQALFLYDFIAFATGIVLRSQTFRDYNSCPVNYYNIFLHKR